MRHYSVATVVTGEGGKPPTVRRFVPLMLLLALVMGALSGCIVVPFGGWDHGGRHGHYHQGYYGGGHYRYYSG
jgi:hypothetical protein